MNEKRKTKQGEKDKQKENNKTGVILPMQYWSGTEAKVGLQITVQSSGGVAGQWCS